MFTIWPGLIRFGSSEGLAAISALNFTPYLRAMEVGVSPLPTVCVFILDAVPAVVFPAGGAGTDAAPAKDWFVRAGAARSIGRSLSCCVIVFFIQHCERQLHE